MTATVPRPHQELAVEAAVRGLKTSSRVSILMACGTGKTLVGAWVAKELSSKLTVVFVPSLALLSQSLLEWSRAMPFDFMCVCGDDTVVEDHAPETQHLKVTTDEDEIRSFLTTNKNKRKVVFSTYQSAKTVETAAEGIQFDLGIFDEAHRTAGKRGKVFATALSDSSINIRRRVFMTATPRIGNQDKYTSMDDEEHYGPTVYSLPFSKAIEDGIICDYEVAVCLVTSEDVTEEMKTGAVDLEHALGRASIKKASSKFNLKRVISFNSSVRSALNMASSNFGGFGVFHVNGTMDIDERRAVIEKFYGREKSVITNARCLVEGVDLPSADMVAFLSPRRSVIDIVQATGRAMRRSPGKVKGIVLVPVLVDSEDADAVQRASEGPGFDRVIEVLRAIKEHDTLLSDVIRKVSGESGEHREASEDTVAVLRQRVRVIGSISDSAFEVVLVKRLGQAWERKLGEVKAFLTLHNKLPNTMQGVSSEEKTLGEWCKKQRVFRREALLSEYQIEALNEIEFDWEPYWSRFEKNIEELRPLLRAGTYPPMSSPLWKWCESQKAMLKKGSLQTEAKRLLDDIGFQWIKSGGSIKEGTFTKLESYLLHGKKPYDRVLERTIRHIRSKRKTGSLDKKTLTRLNSMKFPWVTEIHKRKTLGDWEKVFAAHMKRYGKMPNMDSESEIGSWCHRMRKKRRDEKLSAEDVSRLSDLGFVWGREVRVSRTPRRRRAS